MMARPFLVEMVREEVESGLVMSRSRWWCLVLREASGEERTQEEGCWW
jgi:hypothetical protein